MRQTFRCSVLGKQAVGKKTLQTSHHILSAGAGPAWAWQLKQHRQAPRTSNVSERAVFEKDAEIQSLSVKLEDARRAASDEINELRARLDASEEDKEASSRRLNEMLEEAKTRLNDANERIQRLSEEKSK